MSAKWWRALAAVPVGFSWAIAASYYAHGHWQPTLRSIQTIDFNMLSATLPTKLSILMKRGQTAEIQHTLDSNFGLFGIAVTDCKSSEARCESQKVLWATHPDPMSGERGWNKTVRSGDFTGCPYDLLLDPPPLVSQTHFERSDASEHKSTGNENRGKIIGRVYYIRSAARSFQEDYIDWLRHPLSVHTFGSNYALILQVALLLSVFAWLGMEWRFARASERRRVEEATRDDLLLRFGAAEREAQAARTDIERLQQDCNRMRVALRGGGDPHELSLVAELRVKENLIDDLTGQVVLAQAAKARFAEEMSTHPSQAGQSAHVEFLEPSTTILAPGEVRQRFGLAPILAGRAIQAVSYRDRYIRGEQAQHLCEVLHGSGWLITSPVIHIRTSSLWQRRSATTIQFELEAAFAEMRSDGAVIDVQVERSDLAGQFPHARLMELRLDDGARLRLLFDKGIDFLERRPPEGFVIKESTYIVITVASEGAVG